MIRQTSVETYNAIKADGLLGRLQMDVYAAIFEHGPVTQNELHQYWFPGRQPRDIQPRVSELVKFGVVKEVGKRPCKITRRECLIWDVTDSLPVKPRKDERSPLADCVGKHADAERLVAWINDPQRRPAITAFTEGPNRQVAYAVELIITQLEEAREKIVRIQNGELF